MHQAECSLFEGVKDGSVRFEGVKDALLDKDILFEELLEVGHLFCGVEVFDGVLEIDGFL